MIRLCLIFSILFICGGVYFANTAEPCKEHWKICPEADNDGDYECPISHPETHDFDKR